MKRYTPMPSPSSRMPRGESRLTRASMPRRSPPVAPAPWSVPLAPAAAAEGRKRGSGSGKLTPPAPGEFTAKVKSLVRARAGRGDIFDAQCEACGCWLGHDGGEFQHRDARGMGGSKNPVVNSAANAVLLCGRAALGTGCHGLCEDRDDDQNHMNGMGFWLRNGQDPAAEPIMLHGKAGGGLTLWLAADGIGPDGTGYLLQAPEPAAVS